MFVAGVALLGCGLLLAIIGEGLMQRSLSRRDPGATTQAKRLRNGAGWTLLIGFVLTALGLIGPTLLRYLGVR